MKFVVTVNKTNADLTITVQSGEKWSKTKFEGNYADLVYADVIDFLNDILDEEVVE